MNSFRQARRVILAATAGATITFIAMADAGADGSPTSNPSTPTATTSTTTTTTTPTSTSTTTTTTTPTSTSTTTTTTTTGTTPSSGNPDVTCCGGGGGVYWGFDKLARFTSSSLASTEAADGVPSFVGRYLTYGTPGYVLDSSEVSLFHGDDIPLLLIVDPNDTEQTAAEANTDANTAVAAAKSLGADPNEGIALYRDIEEGDTVTTTYINQYYNDVEGDGYIPGFYEDSEYGAFEGQFCAATSSTISGTLLYASEAHSGSSLKKSSAPTTYNPYYKGCEPFGNVSAWQYLTGSPDVDEGALTGVWY